MSQGVPNHHSPEYSESLRRFTEMVLADIPMLVLRLMGDHVRAFFSSDDLAQEVAVSLGRALDTFEPRTSDVLGDVRALATQIARHRVVDAARQLERMVPSLEQSVLDHARQDGHTPSRIAAKEQALATVRECVSGLDPLDRAIIYRRHALDQTFAKIAEQLDMAEGQVDGRYRRALKQLRGMLDSSRNYQFASSHG